MSIVFYNVEGWEAELLPATIGGEKVLLEKERLIDDTVHLAKDAKVLSVFTWSKVDKAMLEKMPKLKLVATRSTGVDHIDLEACKERGVTVSNVPLYGERTVAEHTFALLLALSRKILHCNNRTKICDFSRDGLRGIDLEGKTMGLIGCGKIGRNVAEIAKAFAMKVVVFDKFKDEELAKRLDLTYLDSVDELLEVSDVVSLHLPLTKETEYIINKDNIDKIKDGAILINTARGNLVQTEALLNALESGKLAGAGLDVLENEKLIHDETELLSREVQTQEELASLLHNHILLTNPKVIITPHNAFNSEEAVRRISDTTVSNIEEFLSGNPQNVVS